VDINTIRAWLGHVSLATTNVYAAVDLERKALTLAKCQVEEEEQAQKPRREDEGLMAFLRSLENALRFVQRWADRRALRPSVCLHMSITPKRAKPGLGKLSFSVMRASSIRAASHFWAARTFLAPIPLAYGPEAV
jgi:hypothetical protein